MGRGHRKEISLSLGKESGQGVNSEQGKERSVTGATRDADLAEASLRSKQ